MNNEKKYGEKKNDIITQCQERGLSFCYGNALKYATRIKKVSEMSLLDRLYHKVILSKGGRSDFFKMCDYIEREKQEYGDYEFKGELIFECNKILE